MQLDLARACLKLPTTRKKYVEVVVATPAEKREQREKNVEVSERDLTLPACLPLFTRIACSNRCSAKKLKIQNSTPFRRDL